jgi:hypothetical protein
MRIRNISGDNDWKFGHSNSDYVREAYAVALDIKLKIQEWYQDCFFAEQNGIDWKTRLGTHNQKELLDNDLLRIAKSVEGVISVFGFNSYVDGRRYRADFQVYQAYSTDVLPISFDSEEVING